MTISENSFDGYEADVDSSNYNQNYDTSQEISKKGITGQKASPIGSSEDSNFHFHASTSPSDRSSDYSGKSEEFFKGYKSSEDEKNSEFLEIRQHENTSLDLKLSNDGEVSQLQGGIKWVSDKIFSGNTRSQSDLNVSKSVNMYSMPMSSQMNSLKDFESLPVKYDVGQNYCKETKSLKYHLKYKNIDLQVSDSSPSVTIRLIDEKDDSSSTLTPEWRSLINDSLSSSNISINELQLPTEMSAYSKGETVKEDSINISNGELKMLVIKNEKSSISTAAHKNLISVYSSKENISGTIYDEKNSSDILITEGKTSEREKKREQHKNEDRSVMFEFDETDNFLNEHTLSDCITNHTYSYENSENVVKENDVLSNSSFENDDDSCNEKDFEGKKTMQMDANSANDANMQQSKMSENVLNGNGVAVVSEEEFSKDFHFEAEGIILTCKPSSESDSVEVKFRKLEDKTKLTLKSGYNKLYLKMSS